MTSEVLTFQLRSARRRESVGPSVDEQKLLREYQGFGLSLDQLLESVFLSYNRHLVVYLRRREWDEATIEDILQSAWVILWNDLRRGTFFGRTTDRATRVKKPMLAFLVKTCENLARNLRRHHRHFPRISVDEVAPQQMAEIICKEICQAEVRLNYNHIMHVALRVCTAEERRVLDLLGLELSRDEIAALTGQKPHWVDNRRRSACRKIRLELQHLRRSGSRS